MERDFVESDQHCRYCDFHDFPCLVYDHECTGQSQGDTKSVMFSHWVEDAEKVIDR